MYISNAKKSHSCQMLETTNTGGLLYTRFLMTAAAVAISPKRLFLEDTLGLCSSDAVQLADTGPVTDPRDLLVSVSHVLG